MTTFNRTIPSRAHSTQHCGNRTEQLYCTMYTIQYNQYRGCFIHVPGPVPIRRSHTTQLALFVLPCTVSTECARPLGKNTESFVRYYHHIRLLIAHVLKLLSSYSSANCTCAEECEILSSYSSANCTCAEAIIIIFVC